MRHNSSHNSITSDVHDGAQAIHEPIDSQNEGETIRSSGRVEHCIVSCDDEDQTGALEAGKTLEEGRSVGCGDIRTGTGAVPILPMVEMITKRSK